MRCLHKPIQVDLDRYPLHYPLHFSPRIFAHNRPRTDTSKIAAALLPSLQEYFVWCRSNPVTSGYPADRIDFHKMLADEYLGEFKAGWSAKPSVGLEKFEGASEKPSNTLSGPDRQIKKLQERLHLSKEEVGEIMPILEKREIDVKDLEQDRSLDIEVRRLKIGDVVAESKARIQSFLNESQRSAFLESEQVHPTVCHDE